MYTTETRLINNLNAAKTMLAHWQAKNDSFWQLWRGDSKTVIINRWQKMVNDAAYNLNAYYVKIGSDKVA